ncbi:MAG: hypothetical protein ACRENP_07250, partial [Longimicrobiales bacterium]
ADWPPAVIAGAFQTGVLGMRTLIRRGVKAVCFDCDAKQSAFRSSWGRAYLCPNPDLDPDAWVTFALQLASELERKPVLIASADLFVSAIAAHADRLDEHYLLSPGAKRQGQLASKETQYALAAQHGMPMPRTEFVQSSEEIQSFAAHAHFPCVLKPIHFREWQLLPSHNRLAFTKVAIANNLEELLDSWRLASVVNPNVILQEIIEGPDRAKRVYLSCYDRDGRRVANAMFQELRCSPLGFGPATVTQPVVDAETDDICDRFLRAINYSGICEIEMKRDTRDGRVKLIEANPRLSGGGDAAPYAGVDLCWLHYLDLIGKTVTPVAPQARDFRHIVLRGDVSTIAEYRRAGLITWGEVIQSYKPPLAFFDFDLRDWRYSFKTVLIMARAAARGVLDWVRARRRPA